MKRVGKIRKPDCIKCMGTNKMRGIGGIYHECDHDEPETESKENPEKASGDTQKVKIDKRSASYKKAIADIKATRTDMTIEEAEKIFADELKSIKE